MAIKKLTLEQVLLNVKNVEWMQAQKGEVLNQLSSFADSISGSGKTKEATAIHAALKKEYGRREKLDAVKSSVAAQVKGSKKVEPEPKNTLAKGKSAGAVITKLSMGTKMTMKDSTGKKDLLYSVRAIAQLKGEEYYLCVVDGDESDYILGCKHPKKNALITPRGWEEPYVVVK